MIDRDTAGALTFIEELSEQGHDLGRLVTDLIEHLRHLMLVQHMGEVPEAVPVTEETRERLRAQANQLPEPTVIRLLDLLAVAVDDMRQGGDPRLPLELAIVKVTRPAADLSRESLSFRLERLEQGAAQSTRAEKPGALPAPEQPAAAPQPQAEAPSLDLSQLQDAWTRTVLPAVEERGGIPTASLLREARPAALSGETLTLEFPATATFHLAQAQEPKHATVLAEALYDVTGRRLSLAFALGEQSGAEAEPEGPAGEERILELLKETFDARERELEASPTKPATPGARTGTPSAPEGE